MAADIGFPSSSGSPMPARRSPGADRELIFELAAEVDYFGIGLIPFAHIASKVGCDVGTVIRQLRRHPQASTLPAKRYTTVGHVTPCAVGEGVPLPPSGRGEWHVKRRHVDTDRIITATVSTLIGLVTGLNLLDDDDIRAVDAEKRLAWIDALREPLRAINHLREVIR